MRGKHKSIYWSIIVAMLGSLFFMASCNKSGDATASGTNVQLEIFNFSPDAYPVAFFLNSVQQNRTASTGVTTTRTYYSYTSRTGSTATDYFYLTSTNYPLQIRSTKVLDSILTTDTTTLKSNSKYTLFVAGLDADHTISSVLTEDYNETLPLVGTGGKIRYVNLSPRTAKTAYDIYANGTKVADFNNIPFLKVSNYVTLPAGNYTFTAYTTGTSTNALTTMGPYTIQDGHLYTLFSQGLTTRVDSAAFTLGVINTR